MSGIIVNLAYRKKSTDMVIVHFYGSRLSERFQGKLWCFCEEHVVIIVSFTDAFSIITLITSIPLF
jgi:IS1 family transposase